MSMKGRAGYIARYIPISARLRSAMAPAAGCQTRPRAMMNMTGSTIADRMTQICHSDMSALACLKIASASAIPKTEARMATTPCGRRRKVRAGGCTVIGAGPSGCGTASAARNCADFRPDVAARPDGTDRLCRQSAAPRICAFARRKKGRRVAPLVLFQDPSLRCSGRHISFRGNPPSRGGCPHDQGPIA